MKINQGFGFNFAHNICILCPKRVRAHISATNLPKGCLIIDPWARALGQTSGSSIMVIPEKFCYRNTLYPIKINYDSSKEEDLEENVTEFLADHSHWILK